MIVFSLGLPLLQGLSMPSSSNFKSSFIKKYKIKLYTSLLPKDIYKEPLLHKHKILNLKNTKVKNIEPMNQYKNLYLVQ